MLNWTWELKISETWRCWIVPSLEFTEGPPAYQNISGQIEQKCSNPIEGHPSCDESVPLPCITADHINVANNGNEIGRSKLDLSENGLPLNLMLHNFLKFSPIFQELVGGIHVQYGSIWPISFKPRSVPGRRSAGCPWGRKSSSEMPCTWRTSPRAPQAPSDRFRITGPFRPKEVMPCL
jgi:hypothetical protein